MKIVLAHSLNNLETLYTNSTSIPSILNYIKHKKGKDFMEEFKQEQLVIIVADSTGKLREQSLPLELLTCPLHGYDTVIFIRGVTGDAQIAWQVVSAIVAVVLTVVTWGAAWYVIVLVMAAWTAISVGVSFLLAPTPDFRGDPAVAQAELAQSNLFNGASLIREQGGITPLIFGNPFAGGVLINSSILTSDLVA